jgi:myo-inositol-1(or 4)-monophosphatase
MYKKRLEFAKSTAVETGKRLIDHFYNGNREAEMKSDRTLVTEADRDADQFIQALIKSEFPADGILSEEGSTKFPENTHVWVLDPLDGTVNFNLGLHYWGVSIAHFKDGIPKTAAVYFPVIDELYSASIGQGAELNGKKLHLSKPRVATPYPVFVHCSRMHKEYKVRIPYKTRSLGSAAYNLSLITKGTAVLAFESEPKLWDYAACWLIIKEAGGVIRALGEQQPIPAEIGLDYKDQAHSILASQSEGELTKAEAGIHKR